MKATKYSMLLRISLRSVSLNVNNIIVNTDAVPICPKAQETLSVVDRFVEEAFQRNPLTATR
jgi:hypothetical protein